MNKKPTMQDTIKKVTDERNLFAKLLEESNLEFEGKVKELSLLKRIGDIISDSFNIESFCQKLVLIIIEETDAENCSLLLKDHGSEKLILKVAYGVRDSGVAFFEDLKKAQVIFSVGEGIAGKVALEGKAIMINDVSKDERFDHSKKRNLAIGSILCCPLIVQNQVLGVINLSSSRINAFSNDDIRSISIFSAFASSILNNAILYNDMSDVNNKLLKAVDTLTVTQKKLKQEIEEGKQAEETLRKSEEKYHNLIEHANDGIISISREGKIIGVNKKAEEMFGYSRTEMIGKPAHLLVAQQHRKRQKKLLHEFAETGRSVTMDKNILEGKARRKDGKTFDVDFSYYILDVHGESIATAIVRDITERKEAEEKLIHNQEQLRSLASQLTKVEEEERRTIASYLHDHIGQELFAIKLQLEQLKKSLLSNGTIGTLESVIDRTNHIMSDMRSMSYELSPPILYELGLKSALEWIVEEMSILHGITITFHDDGKPKPLDETIKVLLFQAVRELLNNVTRHARAQNVEISLARDNARVVIQVNDDGIGFEGSDADTSKDKTQGFGLYSIKERLKYIGGKIDVRSELNGGAKITIIVPLEN